jgi:hypothetical protein
VDDLLELILDRIEVLVAAVDLASISQSASERLFSYSTELPGPLLSAVERVFVEHRTERTRRKTSGMQTRCSS